MIKNTCNAKAASSTKQMNDFIPEIFIGVVPNRKMNNCPNSCISTLELTVVYGYKLYLLSSTFSIFMQTIAHQNALHK